ncbi:MAG: sigma-70 family RNA polymerase sigma factor [Chloroflexota bacterium]|nr:sigma-70 family RNA polymerase sigma factor [Chloroflexota bacterium]
MPLDPADAVLVQRARTGDIVAFETLFEKYQRPIYNMLLRMLKSADDASDLTQDTFIKAYRKFDTLTDETSVRSWIYRIATNTAIDQMRRGHHTVPLDETHDQPDSRAGPEAQAIGRTLDGRIQRALLQLRPNHRQALLLSDVEDMSERQIGELLGMSYGAVRTLLCRARGEMRRHLAAEGLTR